MTLAEFFTQPENTAHKQYEALRAFYVEKRSAQEVAETFGYSLSSFYALTRNFKTQLNQGDVSGEYFITRTQGSKPTFRENQIEETIIELRKKSLSVCDIKGILDTLDCKISERSIYNILVKSGFTKLDRRNRKEREDSLCAVQIAAPKSQVLSFEPEEFSSSKGMGIVCLLPYLQHYGMIELLNCSNYPETQGINRCSSILSFVALKLAKISRYSADDIWCMDRGLGLFARLNVLPKTAWFTSYSHRVTRSMNQVFLQSLYQCWQRHNLLGDSANLDFVSIPYWGDDSHLENNWSGSRNQGLASILAVLAQDPASGIITHADASVRHDNQSEVVIEFLDFYRSDDSGNELKYLIFDSKFTTYKNLRKIEDNPNNIKFITIRRRGAKILAQLNELPSSKWRSIRVPCASGKGRVLQVYEQVVFLQGYDKDIRQIAIAGTGKIKPALIITNDFEISTSTIITKYAKRWLVEQEISEQVHFFHLNRVCSSMVIKVDFDLTMSILAHNLYRLFARDLPGFSHQSASSLFDKFLDNSGKVIIDTQSVTVLLKKNAILQLYYKPSTNFTINLSLILIILIFELLLTLVPEIMVSIYP